MLSWGEREGLVRNWPLSRRDTFSRRGGGRWLSLTVHAAFMSALCPGFIPSLPPSGSQSPIDAPPRLLWIGHSALHPILALSATGTRREAPRRPPLQQALCLGKQRFSRVGATTSRTKPGVGVLPGSFTGVSNRAPMRGSFVLSLRLA